MQTHLRELSIEASHISTVSYRLTIRGEQGDLMDPKIEEKNSEHLDRVKHGSEEILPEQDEVKFNNVRFIGTLVAAGFGMIGVSRIGVIRFS